MDEKIKRLEAEINKIGPKPSTLIQPAGILNLGPSSANENLSIQQEIQNAQRIPVPSEDKQTANYARILSTRREATQRTRLQVPKPAQPETVAPIITYSKEDIIKEAASNIGITKVLDMTIRKFSNLKNKMRYSKEDVWTGPEFSGARNLFVRYYLVVKMKFNEREIRFSDVRFCREPEKGILWLKSDRGFVKSMLIRAAELQDDSVNLINFTPNRAYSRYMAIKNICDQIRRPDPDHIKTQIRPGKSDFEIWIKVIKQGTISKYEKHLIEEFDKDKHLPELEVQMMQSEEVREYMTAANQAIEDAKDEDMRNRDENSQAVDVLQVEDVPFITVQPRNKRKASNDMDREERQNRTTTPDSIRRAVGQIHLRIGYPALNENSEDDDSENNITIE